MKNLKLKYLLMVCLFSTAFISLAIDGDHDEKAKEQTVEYSESDISAGLDEFETLHPLVIHFPIVLLLMAAFSQIAGMFVFKNELSWVTMFILLGGFIGAYVAGSYVHPHIGGELSLKAKQVLKAHEDYASYTTWLSGIGLLLKIVSHFVLKRKMWMEAIVAIVLVGTAFTISKAGHYGAQLTHIEQVEVGEPAEEHGH
jgi:uncharacterized membrane protein